MVTMGEFGAEALDAYETMKTYPPQFAPPPPNEDTLWAASQVEKHDIRQLIGFGENPNNFSIVNVGWLVDYDPSLAEVLRADVGSAFERQNGDEDWILVNDWVNTTS